MAARLRRGCAPDACRTLSRAGTTAEIALVRNYTYDTNTGRLLNLRAGWDADISDANPPTTWFQNDQIAYDQIGNPTSVLDTPANTRECYVYDHWNRLVRAYTSTAACLTGTINASNPGAELGVTQNAAARGVQPFDEQYTYTDIGQLKSIIDVRLDTNVTRTHTYPSVNVTTPPLRPHAVTSVTVTGGPTESYGYDDQGSMTNRNGTGMTWDKQGRLATVGTAQTNIYNVTNQRLIRINNSTGSGTLYLPGIEITGPIAGGTPTWTTYYSLAGSTVAIRTGVGGPNTGTVNTYWNCAQRQNSTTCTTPTAPATATVTPARQRLTPYGNERTGTTTTLPGTDHDFLGQPEDPTGLNYLNNRYHDPAIGAFISVDPLVAKTGQPYLYGNGNPITLSDPSGLEPGCGATAFSASSCADAHEEAESAYQKALGPQPGSGGPGQNGSTSKADELRREYVDLANNEIQRGFDPPPNAGNITYNSFFYELEATNSSQGAYITYLYGQGTLEFCEDLCFATVVGVSDIQDVDHDWSVDVPIGDTLLGVFGFIPVVGPAVDGAAIAGSWAELPRQNLPEPNYIWTAQVAIWDGGRNEAPVLLTTAVVQIGLAVEDPIYPPGAVPGSPGAVGIAPVPTLGLTFAMGQIQTATMDWTRTWIG
jgi:RHS repeat-associated protein